MDLLLLYNVSVPLPGFSIEKDYLCKNIDTKKDVSVPLPGFSIEKAFYLFWQKTQSVSVPLPGFSIEKASIVGESIQTI